MAQATAPGERVRVHHLREAKRRGEPITMLTAYDLPTAQVFDGAGIDVLLVGDSIGNVMLGHATTLPVTLEDMERATRAVAGGAARALVIADLPFGSYEASPEQALTSAVRLMKAGAHGVKFEGGQVVAAQVSLLTGAGIPVVGHLGFTPQSEHALGGPRVQGRAADDADRLIADAKALEVAGAVAVVLELVPAALAVRVTAELAIPTIGIGAGVGCDGQVLVWTDMAGLSTWTPSFVQRFGDLRGDLTRAATAYAQAVRGRTYPDKEHSFQ